jgi:hypothetical protein
MDIYEKLPCGGTWWNFKHPDADKYMQSILEEKAVAVTLLSPPPPLPPQTSASASAAPSSTPPVRVSSPLPSPPSKSETVCVWKFMLPLIDPMYDIYTDNMKRDAEEHLKLKLREIITDVDGHTFFGPRKARSLIAWLSGNDIAENSEIIIAGFLSWLLDLKIIIEGKSNDYDWILVKIKKSNPKRILWNLKK